MGLPPAEAQSVCSSLANKSEQQVVSLGCDILATDVEMLNKQTDVPCAEVPVTAVVEPLRSRRRKRSSRKKGSKSRSSSVNSNDLGTVASVSATSTEASKAQLSFISCNAESSEHGVIDMGLPSVNTNSLGSVKSFDTTPTETCEAEKSTGESGLMSVELPSKTQQSDTTCLPFETEVKRFSTLGSQPSLKRTLSEESKTEASFMLSEDDATTATGVTPIELPSKGKDSCSSLSLSSKIEKSPDTTPTKASEDENSTGESGMMSVELPSKTQQSDTLCYPSKIEVKRSSVHSNTLGSRASLKRTLSGEFKTEVSFILSEDNATTPTGIPSMELPSEEKDSCFSLSLSSKSEKSLNATPTEASEEESSTGESGMMSVELPSKTQQSDTSCSLSEIEIKRFSVHSNTLGSSASLKRTLSEESKTEVSFMLSEDSATTATGMTSMELPSEKKDSCSLLSLSSTTGAKRAFLSTNDVHSVTLLNANEVSKLR